MKTWIDRDGRRLYCYQAGNGEPILLLHATLTSGRFWMPQMEPLLSVGYQVIVPDLAGHGASDPPPAAFSVAEMVEDVWAILDALGLQSCAIAGVSLGALVALAAAAENPSRVKKLVLASTGLSTSNPIFMAFAPKWAAQLREKDGPLASFDLIWKSNLSAEFRHSPEGRHVHQNWHANAAMSHGPSIAIMVENSAGYEVPNPQHLQVETLVVIASKDPMAPMVRELSRTLPRARTVELPDAHHFPNIDSSERFNEALLTFLQAGNS